MRLEGERKFGESKPSAAATRSFLLNGPWSAPSWIAPGLS